MNNVPSAEQFRSFITRIESLLDEKRAINEDISTVKKEASAAGFVVKAMMEVVRQRAKDPEELREFENTVALYKDLQA